MSSLRSMLRGVPQSPKHHPEGDVYVHVRLVRRSLDDAVKMLTERANDADPFRLIEFTIDEKDESLLLRAAAWLHDIGKVTATTRKENGAWSAVGHDRPGNFLPQLRKLSGTWRRMWMRADFAARKDLLFLIRWHMAFSQSKGDAALGKARARRWLTDDGAYRPIRRIKLLLVLVVADRMGRGFADRFERGATVVETMIEAAADRVRDVERARRAVIKPPDDPVEFLRYLARLQKPLDVCLKAFGGKFGRAPSREELSLIQFDEGEIDHDGSRM